MKRHFFLVILTIVVFSFFSCATGGKYNQIPGKVTYNGPDGISISLDKKRWREPKVKEKKNEDVISQEVVFKDKKRKVCFLAWIIPSHHQKSWGTDLEIFREGISLIGGLNIDSEGHRKKGYGEIAEETNYSYVGNYETAISKLKLKINKKDQQFIVFYLRTKHQMVIGSVFNIFSVKHEPISLDGILSEAFRGISLPPTSNSEIVELTGKEDYPPS